VRAILSIIALLVAGISHPAAAQDYPSPTGFVNDFASVLAPPDGSSLNEELATLDREHGVQVAVVTVRSLDGVPVESYARGMATEWGVGHEGRDNGVLFLIAPNERKVRIEVADGIRGQLTDREAARIIDRVVLPDFRNGDLPEGIVNGTHAIMEEVTGTAAPAARTESPGIEIPWKAIAAILAVLVLLGFIAHALWRRAQRSSFLERHASMWATASKAQELARSINVSAHTRAQIKQARQKLTRLMPKAGERGVNWGTRLWDLELLSSGLEWSHARAEEEIRTGAAFKLSLSDRLSRASRALGRTEKTAAHEDVQEATRKRVASLRASFDKFRAKYTRVRRANWNKAEALLDSIEERLEQCRQDAKSDIGYAKKARREGPRLLERLPRLIEQAERRAAKSGDPEDRRRALRARQDYVRAQSMYSSGNFVNWIVLYAILLSANSNSSAAQAYSGGSPSNYSGGGYRPSTYNSPTSYGFGGMGGFGGGGGFSGGGASGGW